MEINKRDIYVLTLDEIMDKFNIPKDKSRIRAHIEESHDWTNTNDKLVLELMW